MNRMPIPERRQLPVGGSRVPSTLQTVFLMGNRGITVNTPPPQRVAHKTFFRGWQSGRSSASQHLRDNSNDTVVKKEQTEVAALTEKASEIMLSPRKKTMQATPSLSPQQYLDALLRSRGYSVTKYATLQSAYHNKPTPLQEASYGVYLTGLVKSRDADALRSTLASGLSSNPSNRHGESLLHRVCRSGDTELLAVMMQAGCDIRTSDDLGRTPLHDACWSSKRDVFAMLLACDSSLLCMTDSKGAAPLSYVRKENWAEWLQFLESKKDVFWPRRGREQPVPELSLEAPNSRPVPAPKKPLTLALARMVASGRMQPDEAQLLQYGVQRETSDADSDDESNGEDLDFSDSSISWEDEMKDILENMRHPMSRPLAW